MNRSTYPPDKYSQVEADLQGNMVYDLEVNIDLSKHRATLKVGDLEVQYELPAELDKIRYVDCRAIRTRTQFGEVEYD